MQTTRTTIAALAAASVGLGVLIGYRAATPVPDAALCSASAAAMTRLELLFGMGRKTGGEISEAEWRAFMDQEVTPRFPDGLTVLTGDGQWRNAAGDIIKETSRVLVFWHRPASDSEAKVEAVRAAYKARFGQESVMRVDGTSCVSF